MSDKFVLMNQAVEQIQTKVTEALNGGQTFTRNDQHRDQYTPCCKMEGLTEDTNFPNVSTNSSHPAAGWRVSQRTLTSLM